MMPEPANPSPQFTESTQAILHAWRVENPSAQRIPRDIRQRINDAVREDNRRQLVEYQRARLDIEAAVREHQHNVLIGYRPRVAETPDIWFGRQQRLAQERLAIEQRINAETRLTPEDRGQAVTALSVAHHAPSVPLLPVYTPQPASGLHALRARWQARLSRLHLGLAGEREQRRLDQWEQVHRDRAEQAQRLPNAEAANAVATASTLGLGDFGVWTSRDTHEQREERLAQLETTAVDREARLSALEDVVAALRTENERLTQNSTALIVQRDHLADQLAAEEQRRAVAEMASDPSAVLNPTAGAGKTAYEPNASNLQPQTFDAATNVPTANEPDTWRIEPDVHQAPASDAATSSLITAAHPNVGTPQPKQSTTSNPTISTQQAIVTPSAADVLDI